MNLRKWLPRVFAAILVIQLGIGPVVAAPSDAPQDPAKKTTTTQAAPKDQNKGLEKQPKKITLKDREKAAARAIQEGALNPLMVAPQGVTTAALPGEAPRYFSHPNYANSPWPTVEGAVISVGNPLIDRTNASDYPVGVGQLAPVFVVVPTALPDGMLQSFQTWNQATPGSSPFPSAGNVFHAYVLRPTGVANQYMVVFDSGQLTVPALSDPAVSAVATYTVANLAVQAGDVLAFYGQGIPVSTGSGSDVLSYPAPNAPLQDSTITLGSPEFPVYPDARTYSFGAQVLDLSGQNTVITGGLRKFVDKLPGLGPQGANGLVTPGGNPLGQYIPVAVPDTTTYSGSDYYVIELGEYQEKLHSDLPPTTLRGYRQAGGNYSYLGPAIVATKDRPVRVLFRNLLPTGADGNLFIPVDTTVMGSGMGPNMFDPATGELMAEADPQKPLCGTIDPTTGEKPADCFTENRATLHLHGGVSPWISDGTPNQWITPAGENASYPQGVGVVPVPGMNDTGDPNDGEMTFFYTNQQSARLMFYHDHALAITRLNVYAGEAAPYIITDDTEKALVNNGILPGADATIPLVVQDKTFVPSPAQLAEQDETWDLARWGGMGSLWVPHVYSPAQNPGDASGVNQYGRWAYGPWFWPPTLDIKNGPEPNPYYLPPPDPNNPTAPACDPDLGWCEPALMPGTPYLSMGMEAFNDTPMVNGTAYPTLTVDPKAYRFRILNAANDRFFNLSLYKAIDANGAVCDAANPNPAAESTGVACTEVALNPGEVAAALGDGTVFPTPVGGTEGPSWIQFGTEGGFLPAPVVIPPQPTTWVNDPTVFNAGNVDQHSLLLGPAERADTVVDFSQFAGQTLILYNDAPAAFPARDPRYDYYTGNGDYRDTGGAPPTLPGYGPNTRTVMQIKVAAATPDPAYDVAALENAFKATSLGGQGVFQNGQNPIIVGQGEYNSAYGTAFQTNGPRNGTVQIYDSSLSFDTLSGNQLTIDLKPKMIQDEQGEAFDPEYGRMSGFLGVETQNAQAGLQNMILYPYVSPPTEVIDGIENMLGPGMDATPIAKADDGTQIWKVTHNGVDTHPIHFHLYDVQLLNRVGWDGIVRKPDANELGWKDTVRISPLEDTILALRPLVPKMSEDLPNSIRLIDPTLPEGAYIANTTAQEAAGKPIFAFNPDGEPIDIVNHYVNYGWEYVWHCHILSHEEMDMMHSQVVGVAPKAPTGLTWAITGSGKSAANMLTWTDESTNETGFVIERRVVGTGDPWTVIKNLNWPLNPSAPAASNGPGKGTRTYSDVIGNTKTQYEYQVYAVNVVGDTWDYSNPAFNNIAPGGGFPTLTLSSGGGATNPATVPTPSGLTGSAVQKNNKTATVTLNWTDASNNETGFLIQRSENVGFNLNVTNFTVGPNVTTLKQDAARGKTFYYRIQAFSATTQSGWSNIATVTTP